MEKNFSASFNLWSMDGLRVQFTVRADDAQDHMIQLSHTIDALSADGWTVGEPDANAKPKTVPIVGWVRASSQDSRTASFQPCVHLYTPWGNFKAATVYHEKLGELPIEWQSGQSWDGAAPDRDNAKKRRVYSECEAFQIVLAPRMDYEGNVRRSDSGNIMYQYDRMAQATQKPQKHMNGAHPSNRTVTHRNEPQRPASDPTDDIRMWDDNLDPIDYEEGLFDGPSNSTLIHMLGTAIYGSGKGWDKRRAEMVKRFGADSSNDLDPEQMWQFVELLRQVAITFAERSSGALADGEIDFMLAEHNDGNTVALQDAPAKVLAAVVKDIQAKKKQAQTA